MLAWILKAGIPLNSLKFGYCDGLFSVGDNTPGSNMQFGV